MTGRHSTHESWPLHLRPGALRWVRASSHYEETVTFYRDYIGLPVVGEFTSSYGEDGTIFGLPDMTTQMEIVRATGAVATNPFDDLVFYLADSTAADAATSVLGTAGLTPDDPPHAYWAANGATVFRDPDGRRVVFAPWIYGQEPEPSTRTPGYGASP